jgi:hypothetical protein
VTWSPTKLWRSTSVFNLCHRRTQIQAYSINFSINFIVYFLLLLVRPGPTDGSRTSERTSRTARSTRISSPRWRPSTQASTRPPSSDRSGSHSTNFHIYERFAVRTKKKTFKNVTLCFAENFFNLHSVFYLRYREKLSFRS